MARAATQLPLPVEGGSASRRVRGWLAAVVVVRGALARLEPDGVAKLDEVLAEVAGVAALSEIVHEVGEAVGDGVQLVLNGLVTAGLRVLQQRDQKKRHDC